MRLLLSISILASLIAAIGTSAQKEADHTWGDTINGLQMTVYRDQTDSRQPTSLKFTVELRNAGKDDLNLNLGTIHHQTQRIPNAVVVTLTDAEGKSWKVGFFGPIEPNGAFEGRPDDPFVLRFPAGVFYTIPLDLDAADYSKLIGSPLRPGSYSLKAQFTGRDVNKQNLNLDMMALAEKDYWKGSVTSNQLRFVVPSE